MQETKKKIQKAKHLKIYLCIYCMLMSSYEHFYMIMQSVFVFFLDISDTANVLSIKDDLRQLKKSLRQLEGGPHCR